MTTKPNPPSCGLVQGGEEEFALLGVCDEAGRLLGLDGGLGRVALYRVESVLHLGAPAVQHLHGRCGVKEQWQCSEEY